MPTWLATLIAAAAALTALGTIWRLFLKPMAELVVLGQKAIPLMREIVRLFGGEPKKLDVLDEIASQFKTDSGSSLRDVVNGLADVAKENSSAAEVLKVQVEAGRLLDVRDREQTARLLQVIDRLTVKVDAGDVKHDAVAADLLASHLRADATEGTPGEAADAASRSADAD